ncbi:hypothetical protein GTP46_09480 [Duganella sp. FT135W]|uniref:Uncharacterized protein n=1 Tax=Duganella flavida TaxID=2692175 RepID=A0A6L8K796_9BURK|nr:hypothetical protein [Duganella flavida]MYM22875.1 hypothetical protein [Duganella flavida]
MTQPSPKSAQLVRALIYAALLLGMAALVRFYCSDTPSPEWTQRLFGVLTGCAVIWYANKVPKALLPLAYLRCDPAVEQSLRRVCGWSLLLGGLGYVIAWLAAPIAWAYLAAAAALGSALCVFLLCLAWRWGRRS